MGKRWLPLESNPEIISEFAARVGLDATECGFYDVYGLDDVRFPCISRSFKHQSSQTVHSLQELLMMVPQPTLAVFLLFPVTDEIEAAAKAGVHHH